MGDSAGHPSLHGPLGCIPPGGQDLFPAPALLRLQGFAALPLGNPLVLPSGCLPAGLISRGGSGLEGAASIVSVQPSVPEEEEEEEEAGRCLTHCLRGPRGRCV